VFRASSYSDPHCTATCVKVGTICVDVVSNSRKIREPTSGLEPLTPALYECAVRGC
jgi:hypothetical protein